MLEVDRLHLWRGERHVLRGVSFQGQEGQCVLLTGRNGSGKTSLIRAIAGLLDPEQGEVRWRGRPTRAARQEFHAELAYLGHEPPLKGDLTPLENLEFATGIRRTVDRGEIESALARTGASGFADRPVRTLSAGQKRRVALAGVWLAGAVLWLLDEPTTNLDVEGQQLVAGLVEDHLATQGLVVAAVHHDLTLSRGELRRFELEGA